MPELHNLRATVSGNDSGPFNFALAGQPDFLKFGDCAEADPRDFYPEGGRGRPRKGHASIAKEICAGCPVRVKCLAWAMETREPWGVWGGLDQHERARLRKERAA